MERRSKAVFAAGWVLLGLGVLFAYRDPARGYELSVYRETPVAFWIAVALALVIAVVTVLAASRRTAAMGGALGIGAVSAILFLPVIRGYYYVSIGDSITHLGFARDILTTPLALLDVPYPGLHLFGIAISNFGGVDLRTALLLASYGIIATFLVSAPLLVRELSSSPTAVRYGILVTLLLLPINGVSIHLRPHPFTQMVFFTPVFLYVLVQVKRSRRPTWIAIFLTVGVGLLLYHVQAALTLAAFALVVAAVDYYLSDSRFGSFDPVRERRHILSLSLAFLILSVTYILDLLIRLLSSLAFRVFVEPQSAVEERTEAAAELGVDPALLVLRTGGPEIVLFLFALVALGAWLHNRDEPWIGYFAVGSLVFAGIGALFVVARQINQFTRYGSLGLVIVTILAPIGLAAIDGWSRPRVNESTVRTVAVVAFCALLLASVPAMFIGPFTERPNQHITEAMYEGTESAFEYDDGQTPYYGVNVDRFDHAIYGVNDQRIANEERLDGEELDYEFSPEVLATDLESDRYLLLTTYQYEQDVTIHDGVRNSESDYEGLDEEPRIDRVSSGEETTLYKVSASAEG